MDKGIIIFQYSINNSIMELLVEGLKGYFCKIKRGVKVLI